MLAYTSRSGKFNQGKLEIIDLIRSFLDLGLTVCEEKEK